MHKVKRNKAPIELENKNIEIRKMDTTLINSTKEWEKFSNTKLKKETLKSLQDMYAYCCAYCEGEIESVTSGHIEHLKPKSLFPKLMFDYNNLHYSCPKCNLNKREKYDERMIDPTVDNPEEHIYFKGISAKAYDERGQIMIDNFKLNDAERTRSKANLLNELDEDIQRVIKKSNNIENMSKDLLLDYRNQILIAISKIEKHSIHGSEYCTMCKQYFAPKLKILKAMVKSINKKLKID